MASQAAQTLCHCFRNRRVGATFWIYLAILIAVSIISFPWGREANWNISVKKEKCSWSFTKYTPSAWEKFWVSTIEQLQYDACNTLKRPDQLNASIHTLRRIVALQSTSARYMNEEESRDVHFSRMHYRYECDGSQYEAHQYIEPLIGLIRDPLTMCPNHSLIPLDLRLDGEDAIQSKRFLLLAPSSPFQVNPKLLQVSSLPPWLYSPDSKKILIDIGSSYFNSRNGNTAELGARWFYEYFKARSMRFDRIIGFEYQQLVPRRVWEELPNDVFPFYTFINVGVESSNTNFNPWKFLEAIAKPNDYVVVKLDIDTPPLESALIEQLLYENNGARVLIDELFFEKHVSLERDSKDDKLRDSYAIFTKFREYGVRMHGWP